MKSEGQAENALYDIPVAAVLAYVEAKTGRPFPPAPLAARESGKWHGAIREGLSAPLHIDLGETGHPPPGQPVTQNAAALHAALLLGKPRLTVALKGDVRKAVREGLLAPAQLPV